MELIIISAISENGVIGNDMKIPWHIKEDFQRFKRLTSGYAVIMGRKTFESLSGKPLPNRLNIVLTSNNNYESNDVLVRNSFEEAINSCRDYEKAFIIGGESVYREGLKFANRLELTKVMGNYEGDAYFPNVDYSKWNLINLEDRGKYVFESYIRNEQ